MKKLLLPLLLTSFALNAAEPTKGEQFIQRVGRAGAIAVGANFILNGLNLPMSDNAKLLAVGTAAALTTQTAVNGSTGLRNFGIALLAATALNKMRIVDGQAAVLLTAGTIAGTTGLLEWIQSIK